jgi:mRNA-degrading endonuclease RelE of RelBE toxin-antitoxin system
VSYEIVFKRKARKRVVRLPENLYERVTRAIDAFATDPRPALDMSCVA